jgi:hypothetical protein
MTTTVKAADFQVVAEARRAVQSQMSFFNRMMDAKKAGIASEKSPRVAVVDKKPQATKQK